jgi:hypothetical protein
VVHLLLLCGPAVQVAQLSLDDLSVLYPAGSFVFHRGYIQRKRGRRQRVGQGEKDGRRRQIERRH